jgi:hypothetical protein
MCRIGHALKHCQSVPIHSEMFLRDFTEALALKVLLLLDPLTADDTIHELPVYSLHRERGRRWRRVTRWVFEHLLSVT